MSGIVYRARAGSPWNDEDAARLAPELVIYEGKTASEIVLAVKDKPETELYKALEWNDQTAGHEHRCHTIRTMRSCFVEVVVTNSHGEIREAMILVEARQMDPKDGRKDKRGHAIHVFVTPAYAEEHGVDVSALKLLQAERDLVSWKRRYDPYRRRWTKALIQKAFAIAQKVEERDT